MNLLSKIHDMSNAIDWVMKTSVERNASRAAAEGPVPFTENLPALTELMMVSIAPLFSVLGKNLKTLSESVTEGDSLAPDLTRECSSRIASAQLMLESARVAFADAASMLADESQLEAMRRYRSGL